MRAALLQHLIAGIIPPGQLRSILDDNLLPAGKKLLPIGAKPEGGEFFIHRPYCLLLLIPADHLSRLDKKMHKPFFRSKKAAHLGKQLPGGS